MPAVSKKQQRFFGMVRAAQKGEMENPSPEVAKVAASAKRSDVKDFASTKHKGLPMKKKTFEQFVLEAKSQSEQRYCPKCKKMETKSECVYGPQYWENNATKREPTNEGAAWTKKAGKSASGGLNEKGRKSYERENPGSDLKAPSKKVGNPRRASFCARMKGMKSKLTSKKTASDPNSRINKSLRAWNC